jgi:hypothetical protein
MFVRSGSVCHCDYSLSSRAGGGDLPGFSQVHGQLCTCTNNYHSAKLKE